MNTKNILSGSLIALSMLLNAAPLASAQTIVAQPVPATCLSLQSNLRFGASDYATGGAITALQNFLVAQGQFNGAYLGSGRFGSLTFAAVARFQALQGIPATGYVGPLTRAAISTISCGGSISNSPVTMYSISPSAGAVGNTVSITGFGFTSDNTVLMDGMVAARSVPITSSIAIACTTNSSCHGGINQTIQFTVPQYLSPNCAPNMMCAQLVRQVTAGTYNVTVVNSNGTSNTLSFTVNGSNANQTLSINGLDAPATLTIGQSGSWTVHALTNTANSNLHYSVVWGDENQYSSYSIMAPQTSTVSSSATFTHIYRYSGTYTPTFTVTDDQGHSVTASNSIVVQPVY